MFSSNFPLSSAICITSTVAVLVASTWLWKRYQKNGNPFKPNSKRSKPRKWIKVGTVKKLMIYPIKSCQGISVDQAVLTGLGLKFPHKNVRDRDFLLVDGNGRQLTMVNLPKMALINMTIEADGKLTLTAPDMPNLTLSCPKPNGKNNRTCKIKTDVLKVLDCGDEVASWFQKCLGKDALRLCYYHLNVSQRSFEEYQRQCPQFGKSDFGSFQNATAYMMIALESVHELNKHLPQDKQCTWKNFRPTILIDGIVEPFGEVNWSYVKTGNEAGNTILNVAAPCHRCPVTTVNQQAGKFNGDGEPLKTLKTLTYINNKVVNDSVREMLKNRGVMGLRLGLYEDPDLNQNREGATIAVGDSVYAALL